MNQPLCYVVRVARERGRRGVRSKTNVVGCVGVERLLGLMMAPGTAAGGVGECGDGSGRQAGEPMRGEGVGICAGDYLYTSCGHSTVLTHPNSEN